MLTVGNINSFKGYSQFRDLDDFNNNVEMFLFLHKKAFTKTEYMLFMRLTKYAATVPGVATTCIKTILKACKKIDFKLGASESTFHRMKRKAIKLGILEIKPMFRKNESQASNLWVFKRFDGKKVSANCTENLKNDTPKTKSEQSQPAVQKGKIVKQMTPLKAIKYSKASNTFINTKRTEEPLLDYTYTADYVPKEFVQAVKPFFNQAKLIEEYWRMVKIDTYSVKELLDDDTILYTAIHSFKQMIGKLKKGKVNNPIAYFKGVLHKQVDKLYAEIPYEKFA